MLFLLAIAAFVGAQGLGAHAQLGHALYVAKLGELYERHVYADRSLRIATENYQDEIEHSPVGFFADVAGLFVAGFTLNPSAGLKARDAATKIGHAIDHAPDDDMRRALEQYKGDLEDIAALEHELGLQPGISMDEVKRLRLAALAGKA